MFASSKVDILMKNGADLVGAINDASIFLVQAANVSCLLCNNAVFGESGCS